MEHLLILNTGVFLCAELKSVPFVGKMCKGSSLQDRYVLRAGYSKKGGLSVCIILPENIRVCATTHSATLLLAA